MSRKVIRGNNADDIITITSNDIFIADKLEVKIGPLLKVFLDPILPIRISLTSEETLILPNLTTVIVTRYEGGERRTYCGFGAFEVVDVPVEDCFSDETNTFYLSEYDTELTLTVFQTPSITGGQDIEVVTIGNENVINLSQPLLPITDKISSLEQRIIALEAKVNG